MCPFGSRIKYDTHTAGTRRKMLLGACSACLAGFVCVWPSANPHSLHMLSCMPQCHITNISPKLSLHQSDALLKLYPATSTRGPCRVIHYVHSCITRIPQTNRILSPNVELKMTNQFEPDQSSSAEPVGSGATCSWYCLMPFGAFSQTQPRGRQ